MLSVPNNNGIKGGWYKSIKEDATIRVFGPSREKFRETGSGNDHVWIRLENTIINNFNCNKDEFEARLIEQLREVIRRRGGTGI